MVKSHPFTKEQVKWLSGGRRQRKALEVKTMTVPLSRDGTCHSRHQPQNTEGAGWCSAPHPPGSFLTFNLTECNPRKARAGHFEGGVLLCARVSPAFEITQMGHQRTRRALQTTPASPRGPRQITYSQCLSPCVITEVGRASPSLLQARHPQGTGPVGLLRTQSKASRPPR